MKLVNPDADSAHVQFPPPLLYLGALLLALALDWVLPFPTRADGLGLASEIRWWLAALLGVPALAVSLRATRGTYDFSYAAQAAAAVAGGVLRGVFAPRVFLNVNVPKGRPKGYRATVQAGRNHVTSVAERQDPKGRSYFWVEEGQSDWHPHDRSDYQAVKDGYVSVTPLQLDLTAHASIGLVETLLGTQMTERGEQLLIDPRVEVE